PRAGRGPADARPGRLGARGCRPAARGCASGNGGERRRAAGHSPGRGARGRAARARRAARRARAVCRGREDRRVRCGGARSGARVGAPARARPAHRRGDPASRALDPQLSRERGRARGAPRARAREGSDSQVVKRREFLQSVSRLAGWAVSADLLHLYPSNRLTAQLLIPMDDAQSDHLKAYGVTYRVVQAGIKAEWLLNYRGGSFLVPDGPALRGDATLAGVGFEAVE